MKTNRKHGFTIVELVVVIAIIAVLAAVLIPTFASIIKKANDSAYLQERQSQQIADLAEKVEKINYFTWEDFEKKLAEELAKVDTSNTSAIESAVDKAIAKYAENQQSGNTGLTAEQVQKIVNESMKGQLTTAQVEAIVNQAVSKIGGVNVADVQAIVKTAIAGMGQTGLNASQVKAQIAAALADSNLANKESVEAAIAQALAKFDTLSEQEVAAIVSQAIKDTIPSEGTIYIDGDKTLEAGKTYILRTQKSISEVTLTVPNNTEIERIIIDAPNVKTVNIVYETGATQMIPVKLIEVISTASTSTHINVNATSIEVNKGRAVVGDVATVTVATVTAAPSTNANVVIELETGATVTNPVIAEYQDNGTGTNDTITIIDNTTSEDGVKVELTASNELAASGTTTTNVQIQGANYTEDNIESKIDNKVAETASKVEVVEVTVNDTTYVDAGESTNGYSLFAGGSGTKEDPFLIFDYATMQNISKLYDSGYNYFAVDISKTDNGNIDCRNDWIAVKLNGSFDGKGVKFINLDWKLFGNLVPDSYVKNLDIVNCYIRNTGSVAALANYFQGNTLIENVNISGYIEGQGQTAGYASYCSSSTALITFKDCTLTAKVVAIGGQAGGFMVNPYALSNKTGDNLGFVIDNSYIEGQLYSTVSDTGLANVPAYCGYVYAHTITVPVQFKNIDPAKASLCYVEKSASHNNSHWLTNERSHLITVANPTLDLSGVGFGETFSLNVSNDVSYATISFLISPNDHNNKGSYTSTYLTETVNAEAGTITSEIVKKYNVAINGSIDGTTQNQVTTDSTGLASDGETYNVVNSSYGYTHNGVSIFIVLYSASGDVLAYTNAEYIAAND